MSKDLIHDTIPIEVYAFVEKYNKDDRSVLFDFVDSNEFETFRLLIGINYDFSDRPTMVLITNYSLKRLNEGSVYRISSEVVQIIRETQTLHVVEDSLIIGFRVELNDQFEDFFGTTKSFSDEEILLRNIDQSSYDYLPNLNQSFRGNTEVIVKNVGQGSWNEVEIDERIKLVFDIGTIYTTSRANLMAMISPRDIVYQRDQPTVIISHWDVDHYHFIIGLSDAAIQAFQYFICRGYIPNLTSRKIFSRINRLNARSVIAIAPESSPVRRYSMRMIGYFVDRGHSYIFFNGSVHRNRNKSGMGLVIRKLRTSVVFSADLDYSQVSNSMLPLLNYRHNHHLIVPHHGGNAGTFVYTHYRHVRFVDAVISVGNNPYRPPHPWIRNINSLTSAGFHVLRTDYLGHDHRIPVN